MEDGYLKVAMRQGASVNKFDAEQTALTLACSCATFCKA
jgi:hypothetical protein